MLKKTAKRFLSEKNKRVISRYKDIYDKKKRFFFISFISLFLFSGRLVSSLYSLFGVFNGEAVASLLGRKEYINSKANYSLYRRNVHRLEKAMIMRPRRAKFASDYIVELVNMHKFGRDRIPLEQYSWGESVLVKYFSEVEFGVDENIDKARSTFLSINRVINKNSGNKTPYKFSENDISSIEFDDLLTLVTKRKSVRWFQDKEVTISDIHLASKIATQAPSACNRQPYNFYFTNDKDKVEAITSLAMGAGGFLHNIPSVIAVVGDLSYFDSSHDRHLIYIDSALASMQLLLALETLGLNSCVLNWPDIESRDKKINKILGLEKYQRVIFLIAVGYADETGLVPFSEKKRPEELVKVV